MVPEPGPPPAALRVKICGLTRAEDARWAIDCGADFLGVVLCDGPRKLGLEEAADLVSAVRGALGPVRVLAVVRDPDVDTAARVLGASFDGLQLHGRESAQAVRELRHAFPRAILWKAVAVRGPGDLAALGDYEVDAVLLDAGEPGESGGGGKRIPVSSPLLHAAARRGHVVLGGGLTPDNVVAAIRGVQPWAVDVSSGVEEAPGRKSRALVRAFIERARAAARNVAPIASDPPAAGASA